MFPLALGLSGLLGFLTTTIGLIADDQNNAEPEVAAAEKPEPAQALAEYNVKRIKTPKTADAQWKLALWCEQHGLDAEAKAHFATVVSLDPRREVAWKRLGYKKYNGQWMDDEQIKEARETQKAIRDWSSSLRNVHRQIHGGPRQAEAEAYLAKIEDPKAVPAIYREFCGPTPTDQRIAVQVLGQIQGAVSSKTLASLSVYGVSAEVRRLATETLRGRAPEEYVEFLLTLLATPLKYEVRPVGGPGSPGVLFVEGERFNIRRFYAPPPPPNVGFRPGDLIGYDSFGSPVILRTFASLQGLPYLDLSGKTPMRVTDTVKFQEAISPRQLMAEANRAAVGAQMQLSNDIAQVEAINQVRKSFNGLVTRVLSDATGQDLGEEGVAWRDWLAEKTGYAKNTTRPRAKPTFNQLVPLAYQPYFGPEFSQVQFLRQAVPDM